MLVTRTRPAEEDSVSREAGGGGRLWVVGASTVGLLVLSVGAAAATLDVVPAASEAGYRDEARRHNYLRERRLTTARFPEAAFVPHEIRGLPVPPPGATALPCLR